MRFNVLCVVLLLATSCVMWQGACIDDIPSSYTGGKAMKSLFCNACAVLSGIVNETIHDESPDFESQVGFRMGIDGKKIRKQSGWLRIFLSLDSVCDDWKDKYRTAKRENGYLYLIESDVVKGIEHIERERKQKLEREERERLQAIWDAEWEQEKLDKDRIYNLTHDEYGNKLEGVEEQEEILESDSQNTANETETDENKEESEEESEEEEEKKFFYEKKPKVVKRKKKQSKKALEMCYFLNEKMDEWLHEQQKDIQKKVQEGESIKDYLQPLAFCSEEKICKKAMFESKPKIFKFKKDLYVPKKPKRRWKPPIKEVDTEYEEQMEADEAEETAETAETEGAQDTQDETPQETIPKSEL